MTQSREELLAKKRAHYHAHRAERRERDNARNREYDRANREKRTESTRRWEAKHPEKKSGYARQQVLRRHDMTEEQYASLLSKQRGVCMVCGRPPKTRRLAIDHDHKTGVIRGLLCHQCNLYVVGTVDRYPRRIARAIKYVEGKLKSPPPEPL